MKKLVILLFTLVFAVSCGDKKKSDKVVNLDNDEYLPSTGVTLEKSESDSSMESQLAKTYKEIKDKKGIDAAEKNEIDDGFSFKLLIDRDGNIHKLIVEDGVGSYTDQLTDKLLKEYRRKGTINGKPVKYSTTIKSSDLENRAGTGKIDTKSFFVAVEQMPEPVGGLAAIQKNITYPEILKRAGVEGRVYIKAYIDEEGNVVGAEVIKGVHEALNQEALRAVEATKFEPGRQRGVAVKTQVAIPIMFKLE